MTTRLDTLIAAAIEREQLEIRAHEERRRQEEERRTAEQAELMRVALCDALSAELLDVLGVVIEAAPAARWATFVYEGERFSFDTSSNGAQDWLYVAGPGMQRVQVGVVSPLVGKLDEHLLRILGHWRAAHASHAAERGEPTGEALDDDQTFDPPF